MWNHCPQPYLLPLRASVVIAGAPEAEIFSLEAMQEVLRVVPMDPPTTADQANNDRISSYIVSARVHAERHTHRSLVKKPYLMSLSRFPNLYYDRTDKINLWHPPLVGNVSIKYIDENGVLRTMVSGTDFQVDFAGTPGRVAPLAQTTWPATKWGVLNPVQIFYTAGYEPDSTLRLEADAVSLNVEEPETDTVDHPATDSQIGTYSIDRTIPADLADGVAKLISHWYTNRIPIVTVAGAGGTHVVLPWHIEKILDDYVFDTLTPTVSPEF